MKFITAFFLLIVSTKTYSTACPTPESYRNQMQALATWCNNPPTDPSNCFPTPVTGKASTKIHIRPDPYLSGKLQAVCQAFNCAGERNPYMDDYYPVLLCTNYPATASVGISNFKVTNSCGSIIENINRVVGEEIKLTGVPFTLVYNSKFTTGFKKAYKIDIPIIKATVPSYLTNVVVTMKDSNNSIVDTITYLPIPNQTYNFNWNGLDSSSNQTWGRIKRTITIKENTPDFNVDLPPYELFFGTLKAKKLGIGGWLPSIWAFYDFESKTFYGGDGTNRSVSAITDGNYYRIASSDSKLVYYFDSVGKLSHTKTWLTGTTIFTFNYDVSGRLSSITQPFNKTTTFSRNSNGKLLEIIGSNGAISTISLDANDYLSEVVNPLNESHSMTYYGTDGLINTFTTPSGDVTTMTYNVNGELVNDIHTNGFSAALSPITNGIQSISTLGRISKNILVGFQETLIRPSGFTKYITNDPAYTSVQSAMGDKSTWLAADPRFGTQATRIQLYSFDNFGSRNSSFTNSTTLNSVANPFSIDTMIDTETVGNSINTSTYTGSTRTTNFSTRLNRTAQVQIDQYERPILSQVGNLTARLYNYTNDLLTKISEGTREVDFTYNSQGLIESVQNSLNQATSFTYDDAQRITSTILPDNRVVNYSYDYNGNLTSITPPLRSNLSPSVATPHTILFGLNNKISTYIPPTITSSALISTLYNYNNDNQLTKITRPNGEEINFNYNLTSGLLDTLTGSFGTISNSYNNELPTSITDQYGNRIDNVYSKSVIKISNLYKNNMKIYSYERTPNTNAGEKIAKEIIKGYGTGSVTQEINYGYDFDEFLTSVGSLTLVHNTPNGQLTGTTLDSLTDNYSYNGFGEISNYQAKYGATIIYEYTLTRDAIGRINQKVETLNNVTNTFDYEYDSAGRLVEVSTNNIVTSTYSYDENSNRIGGVIRGEVTSASYDSQDRLTNYNGVALIYNTNGELLSKGSTTLNYDVFGNLKTWNNETYSINYDIDPSQRRMGRSVGGVLSKRFMYSPEGRLVGQLDNVNNLVKTYVYGSKSHVPDYYVDSLNNSFRIITDHLGSVRLVVNSAGVVQQLMEHDEFGRVLQDTNPGLTTFGFAGGLYDSSTSLIRFGARDYDSQTGRWTSKDPILFGGMDANLYGYAFQDPINFFDPDGLTGRCSDPSGCDTPLNGMPGGGSGSSLGGIDFIVSPNGTAFPAYGAKGPQPVINGSGNVTGSYFSGSTGGINGQVFGLRIMNPTPPMGNSPGYQNGYIRYFNGQPNPQAVDPYSGQTLPNSCGHYPIK